MHQTRHLQNFRAMRGWGWGGPYKLERNLFILHRATGLILLFIFLAYAVSITISGIEGQDTWAATLLLVHTRWFGVITTLFIFHAMNGLRLGVQETGLVLGQPGPPAYPFRDALRKNRIFTWIMLSVTAILISIVLFLFFIVGVWQ